MLERRARYSLLGELSAMLPRTAAGAAARLPPPAVPGGLPGGPPFQPGTKVLVTFMVDPGYWHERLVLYPATLHSYAIMTGDGDEYVEHEAW